MSFLYNTLRRSMWSLCRTPSLTLAAAVTLTIGVGLCLTITNVVDRLLLRNLPVFHPQELVSFVSSGKINDLEIRQKSFTWRDFQYYRIQPQIFSEVTAFENVLAQLGQNETLRHAQVQLVHDNYFSFFGITMLHGRSFHPDENKVPNAVAVAIISESLWGSYFNRTVNIIGQSLRVNGKLYSVIGVAPKGFNGTYIDTPTEVWLPLMMRDTILTSPKGEEWQALPKLEWLELVGRLKKPVERVQSEILLNKIVEQWHKTEESKEIQPNAISNFRILLVEAGKGMSRLRDKLSRALWFLWLISGCVLLIACANAASLLVLKTTTRRKEIAIRLTLGASRWHLAVQIFTETLLLASGACLLSYLLAPQIIQLFLRFQSQPEFENISLINLAYWRFVVITLAFILFIAVSCSALPFFQASSIAALPTLKREITVATERRLSSASRYALIIFQIAISFAVLVCTGLYIRSLYYILNIDKGFVDDNVVLGEFKLPENRYALSQTREFFEQLRTQVSSTPIFIRVSLAQNTPLSGAFYITSFDVPGYTPAANQPAFSSYSRISEDFFETLGIKITQGRSFNNRDRNNTLPVVVVNEAFSRQFLPSHNPIGQKIRLNQNKSLFEIIGITQDVKYASLIDEIDPHIYFSVWQISEQDASFPRQLRLVTRVSTDTKSAISTLRGIVRKIDPELSLFQATTMTQELNSSISTLRMITALACIFGALAVMLAVIGLYSVLTFSVQRRTREIGIRLALGAEPQSIFSLVLREGLWLTCFGIILGIIFAQATTRLTESYIYNVKNMNWLNYLTVIIFLLIISLITCLWPAIKAVQINPQEALRHE